MFFIIFYYVRVDILLTFGKQLHDRIITLRFGAHSTSLTPPHYIEVPVPSHENDESSICVLEVFTFLYEFSIGYWNCSDSVIFLLCFSFYLVNLITLNGTFSFF